MQHPSNPHKKSQQATDSLKEKLAAKKSQTQKAGIISLADLSRQYAEERKTKEQTGARNFILTGRHGSGKTLFSITGKRPILAHSFDPGDLETIQEEIDEGWIIPNSRWEDESHTDKPWAWEDWLKEMERLRKGGVFNQIGTFVLHSFTGLNTAAMNYVMGAQRLRSGDIPKWEKDYQPVQTILMRAIRECCSLPCDFVMSCHVTKEEDAMSGRMFGTISALGKGNRVLIPTLFSEIYFLEARPNPKNVRQRQFVVHTQPEGIWDARTRMGNHGKLDAVEVFDMNESPCGIEKFYKKAGYEFSHVG